VDCVGAPREQDLARGPQPFDLGEGGDKGGGLGARDPVGVGPLQMAGHLLAGVLQSGEHVPTRQCVL